MPWDHQIREPGLVAEAVAAGHRRIAITSPTGSGKTHMIVDKLIDAMMRGEGAVVWTNRRLLLEQSAKVLAAAGIEFGIRAAGYGLNYDRPIQIAMLQSETARVYGARKVHDLHPAKTVIIDELHVNKGPSVQRIIQDYVDSGATVLGYTATPLDVADVADTLVVAAKMSDCFACGATVPANTFGPDEPDLRHIKRYRIGADISEADNAKAIGIGRPGVFGRVYSHWERLNPERYPTILFAPDVAGSLWFAENFHANGVSSAHIDGDKIWYGPAGKPGKFYDSMPNAREELRSLLQHGQVQVVCNRFVLREGIDLPFLRFGILATIFGSLTSYIQSCGRLLRSSPGKTHATIIDHGGNWWKHGSVNMDRDWELGDNNYDLVTEFQEKQREAPDEQPICCPKCFKIRLSGNVCPFCGFVCDSRSRMVVQVDGRLKEYKGLPLPPRKIRAAAGDDKLWERMYYRMGKANKTFRQAYGLFRHEHGHWPAKNLPLMPISVDSWGRKIGLVHRDNLYE